MGVVTRIRRPLFWSPDIYSYTWYARELVSLGESVFGTTHVANYAGGVFSIHVDIQSNHSYGVNPGNVGGNGTVPDTFIDGHATYLEGYFESCTVTWDTSTNQGSWLGEITFTGGNAFPQLESAFGWTLGSHMSGVSPAGYCAQVNGEMFVQGPMSTDQMAWSGIKSLFR